MNLKGRLGGLIIILIIFVIAVIVIGYYFRTLNPADWIKPAQNIFNK
jgi:uncharacterized membrane protein YccC